MKLDFLAELVEKHKSDKNFQHRDKSWDEIDVLAKVSFLRLTPEQQKKVVKVCKKFDLTDLNLISRYRFMAQTNLFFLCKLLEKYKDVSEKEYLWKDGTVHNTHEEICNEFFVRKDPTRKDFKDFANEYLDKKERLLLVPRGGFKSSIDMADCVQWIICFPEITILVLTGVLDLAKDFVGEIKGHFELQDGEAEYADLYGMKKIFKPREMNDGSLSFFQILFPEHCVPKEDGKSYEYQTPAVSIIQKESTVFAASIEQNLTGWHVDIMKLDDVVTNENSQTIDRLKNINKQVSINAAMMHPYGFFDKIGTWYDSEDIYGQDIKNEKKAKEEGEDFPVKIYIRPAWWANENAEKQGKIEDEMLENDWVLWFNDGAHSLTYKFLRQKKKTDPWFAIKYLNDPTQMHVVKFPRELLIRKTIPMNQIPGTGMIVMCVDTAYSTKSWADYTVVLTALIYGGRFYIIDMARGKFNEYELPAVIAANILKWKPKRVCIEESTGVKWMGRELYREMDKLKVRTHVEFVPLGYGSKKNSKQMKAKPVLRHLGDDRLFFANTCSGLDQLYDELERFGTAAGLHDDIVDALSILVAQFGSYAEVSGKMDALGAEFVADPKAKLHYDMTYGTGKFEHLNAMAMEFPDMSPQELVEADVDAAEANHDPLSDLFG